jgi:hypothetical protein
MLVIVAAEVLLGVLVLVRFPAVAGRFVVVAVPLVLAVPVGMAVLVQMFVGMGVGVGVGVRHVAMGVRMGVHMAVLVAVLVLVLVPRGLVVMMAAVHDALPQRKPPVILRRVAPFVEGGRGKGAGKGVAGGKNK